MKISEGFRIPEASDKVIQWPPRGTSTQGHIAVWHVDSLCWLVTGENNAYGDPRRLVYRYGNDWYAVTITPTPEGNS